MKVKRKGSPIPADAATSRDKKRKFKIGDFDFVFDPVRLVVTKDGEQLRGAAHFAAPFIEAKARAGKLVSDLEADYRVWSSREKGVLAAKGHPEWKAKTAIESSLKFLQFKRDIAAAKEQYEELYDLVTLVMHRIDLVRSVNANVREEFSNAGAPKRNGRVDDDEQE